MIPTVHVIDDDESFLRSMARRLRSHGYRVATHEPVADFPDAPIADRIAAINRAIDRAAREREERLKRADGGRELSKLTDRELQMLLRIVKGMQNKEMAEEYGLSERTVKYHRPVLTRRIDRYASVDLTRLADRPLPL